METLKDRLKYARELRNLSQKEIADRIPTTQSTINDIESGKNKSTRYLLRLSDILEVDARWLERGVGSLTGNGIEIVNQGAPLPLYEWDDLATVTHNNGAAPGIVDMVHRCPMEHSQSAFSLTSNSLNSTGVIGEGETIFVDPRCTYTNGCYVVCLVGSIALLRQLVTDGLNTYMKTTNRNLDSHMRMIPINPTAREPGVINLPLESENGKPVLLAGRVIMRMQALV